MTLKIHAVGGYSEVGKNMTVLELDEDAFIFDEGFFLPPITMLEEQNRNEYQNSEKKLREIKAVPDDFVIDNIRHKVRAQFIGHAHLDHVGAIPFLSNRYNAPIYGTPFTINVLKSLMGDSDLQLRNNVKVVHPNTSVHIQGKNRKYLVDFINITHSTLQASMIAIHTPKGVVLYANDFKLDNHPIVGNAPNYEKLKQIAKEGVYAFIVDSLYSSADRKTPSEKIARNLLEEVLLTIQNRNAGIIVTTFSSHIARLKSIVDFGNQLNRDVVFLGSSLNKYVAAANDAKLVPFFRDVKIMKYRRQVDGFLKKIERNRKDFLLVCTGHQGEPGSVLERISRGSLPYKVNENDNIVFSSSVIPTEINKDNFAKMEDKLRKRKARIFRDVHVSGHPGREDLRDIVQLLSPQHIIPAHGGFDKTSPMVELAEEMGYKKDKQVHLMKDGDILVL